MINQSQLSQIPTREQCQEIVKKSECFYCTETNINGFNVEMYDYRFATAADFETHNAYELRGLTFVQAQDGTWQRNILLDKFFNLDQCSGWMQEDVKDLEITRVQEKLDGSVISFVLFPDGEVRAKSKMSFTSYQAQEAQILYDNSEELYTFVNKMLKAKVVPIFEFVSYNNQIVVNYNCHELRLIQLRSLIDGSYYTSQEVMSILGHEFKNIKFAQEHSKDYRDLDVLLFIKENSKENHEGFVVTFSNGKMAKIKTNWYMLQHHLMGPDAFRENTIVETILNDEIDDVISQLQDGPKRELILKYTSDVQHYMNHLIVQYKELRRKYFQDFEEDRKAFAMKYKNEMLFGSVMKELNTSFTEVEQIARKRVKELILNRTKTLTDAKNFLNNLSNFSI